MGVIGSVEAGGCRRGTSPEGRVSGVNPVLYSVVLTSSCFTGAAPAVMANAVKMVRRLNFILAPICLYMCVAPQTCNLNVVELCVGV